MMVKKGEVRMEATPSWKHRSIKIDGQVLINVDYLDDKNLNTSDLQIVESFLEGVVDDLRQQALKAIGDPTRCLPSPSPRKRKPANLTDEERERRRQRMKEFWINKRSVSVEKPGEAEAMGQDDA
jgi:hypothetical protein